MKRIVLGSSLVLLSILFGCNNNPSISEQQGEPQVIDLTQTGCQFLETESKDYQFKTNSKKDCEGINSETLAERQSSFQPLNLKPGKYIFRVTNRNVPYELGFYLRGEGLNQARLPKVSGGGLTTGATQDYEITLVSGKYVFSCPLNPTPDYPVIVQ
ncbi:MAG: hypothetical protein F6K58_15375 [Symploca sp. SIO2E9]|nr:hypothetical protein [Symploca sp. SIO2E9]